MNSHKQFNIEPQTYGNRRADQEHIREEILKMRAEINVMEMKNTKNE